MFLNIIKRIEHYLSEREINKQAKYLATLFGYIYQRKTSKTRPYFYSSYIPVAMEKIKHLDSIKEMAYRRLEQSDEKGKVAVKIALEKIEEMEKLIKDKN